MANGLSQSQRRTLFATIREAAREVGEEQEAYRRRVMAEELGVEHLADVGHTSDYDRLMARICKDAGKYDLASRYADGDLKRYRRSIMALAERIAPGNEYRYLAGVLIQAKILNGEPDMVESHLHGDSAWRAISTDSLRRVFIMLSTHLKRSK